MEGGNYMTSESPTQHGDVDSSRNVQGVFSNLKDPQVLNGGPRMLPKRWFSTTEKFVFSWPSRARKKRQKELTTSVPEETNNPSTIEHHAFLWPGRMHKKKNKVKDHTNNSGDVQSITTSEGIVSTTTVEEYSGISWQKFNWNSEHTSIHPLKEKHTTKHRRRKTYSTRTPQTEINMDQESSEFELTQGGVDYQSEEIASKEFPDYYSSEPDTENTEPILGMNENPTLEMGGEEINQDVTASGEYLENPVEQMPENELTGLDSQQKKKLFELADQLLEDSSTATEEKTTAIFDHDITEVWQYSSGEDTEAAPSAMETPESPLESPEEGEQTELLGATNELEEITFSSSDLMLPENENDESASVSEKNEEVEFGRLGQSTVIFDENEEELSSPRVGDEFVISGELKTEQPETELTVKNTGIFSVSADKTASTTPSSQKSMTGGENNTSGMNAETTSTTKTSSAKYMTTMRTETLESEELESNKEMNPSTEKMEIHTKEPNISTTSEAASSEILRETEGESVTSGKTTNTIGMSEELASRSKATKYAEVTDYDENDIEFEKISALPEYPEYKSEMVTPESISNRPSTSKHIRSTSKVEKISEETEVSVERSTRKKEVDEEATEELASHTHIKLGSTELITLGNIITLFSESSTSSETGETETSEQPSSQTTEYQKYTKETNEESSFTELHSQKTKPMPSEKITELSETLTPLEIESEITQPAESSTHGKPESTEKEMFSTEIEITFEEMSSVSQTPEEEETEHYSITESESSTISLASTETTEEATHRKESPTQSTISTIVPMRIEGQESTEMQSSITISEVEGSEPNEEFSESPTSIYASTKATAASTYVPSNERLSSLVSSEETEFSSTVESKGPIEVTESGTIVHEVENEIESTTQLVAQLTTELEATIEVTKISQKELSSFLEEAETPSSEATLSHEIVVTSTEASEETSNIPVPIETYSLQQETSSLYVSSVIPEGSEFTEESIKVIGSETPSTGTLTSSTEAPEETTTNTPVLIEVTANETYSPQQETSSFHVSSVTPEGPKFTEESIKVTGSETPSTGTLTHEAASETATSEVSGTSIPEDLETKEEEENVSTHEILSTPKSTETESISTTEEESIKYTEGGKIQNATIQETSFSIPSNISAEEISGTSGETSLNEQEVHISTITIEQAELTEQSVNITELGTTPAETSTLMTTESELISSTEVKEQFMNTTYNETTENIFLQEASSMIHSAISMEPSEEFASNTPVTVPITTVVTATESEGYIAPHETSSLIIPGEVKSTLEYIEVTESRKPPTEPPAHEAADLISTSSTLLLEELESTMEVTHILPEETGSTFMTVELESISPTEAREELAKVTKIEPTKQTTVLETSSWIPSTISTELSEEVSSQKPIIIKMPTALHEISSEETVFTEESIEVINGKTGPTQALTLEVTSSTPQILGPGELETSMGVTHFLPQEISSTFLPSVTELISSTEAEKEFMKVTESEITEKNTFQEASSVEPTAISTESYEEITSNTPIIVQTTTVVEATTSEKYIPPYELSSVTLEETKFTEESLKESESSSTETSTHETKSTSEILSTLILEELEITVKGTPVLSPEISPILLSTETESVLSTVAEAEFVKVTESETMKHTTVNETSSLISSTILTELSEEISSSTPIFVEMPTIAKANTSERYFPPPEASSFYASSEGNTYSSTLTSSEVSRVLIPEELETTMEEERVSPYITSSITISLYQQEQQSIEAENEAISIQTSEMSAILSSTETESLPSTSNREEYMNVTLNEEASISSHTSEKLPTTITEMSAGIETQVSPEHNGIVEVSTVTSEEAEITSITSHVSGLPSTESSTTLLLEATGSQSKTKFNGSMKITANEQTENFSHGTSSLTTSSFLGKLEETVSQVHLSSTNGYQKPTEVETFSKITYEPSIVPSASEEVEATPIFEFNVHDKTNFLSTGVESSTTSSISIESFPTTEISSASTIEMSSLEEYKKTEVTSSPEVESSTISPTSPEISAETESQLPATTKMGTQLPGEVETANEASTLSESIPLSTTEMQVLEEVETTTNATSQGTSASISSIQTPEIETTLLLQPNKYEETEVVSQNGSQSTSSVVEVEAISVMTHVSPLETSSLFSSTITLETTETSLSFQPKEGTEIGITSSHEGLTLTSVLTEVSVHNESQPTLTKEMGNQISEETIATNEPKNITSHETQASEGAETILPTQFKEYTNYTEIAAQTEGRSSSTTEINIHPTEEVEVTSETFSVSTEVILGMQMPKEFKETPSSVTNNTGSSPSTEFLSKSKISESKIFTQQLSTEMSEGTGNHMVPTAESNIQIITETSKFVQEKNISVRTETPSLAVSERLLTNVSTGGSLESLTETGPKTEEILTELNVVSTESTELSNTISTSEASEVTNQGTMTSAVTNETGSSPSTESLSKSEISKSEIFTQQLSTEMTEETGNHMVPTAESSIQIITETSKFVQEQNISVRTETPSLAVSERLLTNVSTGGSLKGLTETGPKTEEILTELNVVSTESTELSNTISTSEASEVTNQGTMTSAVTNETGSSPSTEFLSKSEISKSEIFTQQLSTEMSEGTGNHMVPTAESNIQITETSKFVQEQNISVRTEIPSLAVSERLLTNVSTGGSLEILTETGPKTEEILTELNVVSTKSTEVSNTTEITIESTLVSQITSPIQISTEVKITTEASEVTNQGMMKKSETNITHMVTPEILASSAPESSTSIQSNLSTSSQETEELIKPLGESFTSEKIHETGPTEVLEVTEMKVHTINESSSRIEEIETSTEISTESTSVSQITSLIQTPTEVKITTELTYEKSTGPFEATKVSTEHEISSQSETTPNGITTSEMVQISPESSSPSVKNKTSTSSQETEELIKPLGESFTSEKINETRTTEVNEMKVHAINESSSRVEESNTSTEITAESTSGSQITSLMQIPTEVKITTELTYEKSTGPFEATKVSTEHEISGQSVISTSETVQISEGIEKINTESEAKKHEEYEQSTVPESSSSSTQSKPSSETSEVTNQGIMKTSERNITYMATPEVMASSTSESSSPSAQTSTPSQTTEEVLKPLGVSFTSGKIHETASKVIIPSVQTTEIVLSKIDRTSKTTAIPREEPSSFETTKFQEKEKIQPVTKEATEEDLKEFGFTRVLETSTLCEICPEETTTTTKESKPKYSTPGTTELEEAAETISQDEVVEQKIILHTTINLKKTTKSGSKSKTEEAKTLGHTTKNKPLELTEPTAAEEKSESESKIEKLTEASESLVYTEKSEKFYKKGTEREGTTEMSYKKTKNVQTSGSQTLETASELIGTAETKEVVETSGSVTMAETNEKTDLPEKELEPSTESSAEEVISSSIPEEPGSRLISEEVTLTAEMKVKSTVESETKINKTSVASSEETAQTQFIPFSEGLEETSKFGSSEKNAEEVGASESTIEEGAKSETSTQSGETSELGYSEEETAETSNTEAEYTETENEKEVTETSEATIEKISESKALPHSKYPPGAHSEETSQLGHSSEGNAETSELEMESTIGYEGEVTKASELTIERSTEFSKKEVEHEGKITEGGTEASDLEEETTTKHEKNVTKVSETVVEESTEIESASSSEESEETSVEEGAETTVKHEGSEVSESMIGKSAGSEATSHSEETTEYTVIEVGQEENVTEASASEKPQKISPSEEHGKIVSEVSQTVIEESTKNESNPSSEESKETSVEGVAETVELEIESTVKHEEESTETSEIEVKTTVTHEAGFTEVSAPEKPQEHTRASELEVKTSLDHEEEVSETLAEENTEIESTSPSNISQKTSVEEGAKTSELEIETTVKHADEESEATELGTEESTRTQTQSISEGTSELARSSEKTSGSVVESTIKKEGGKITETSEIELESTVKHEGQGAEVSESTIKSGFENSEETSESKLSVEGAKTSESEIESTIEHEEVTTASAIEEGVEISELKVESTESAGTGITSYSPNSEETQTSKLKVETTVEQEVTEMSESSIEEGPEVKETTYSETSEETSVSGHSVRVGTETSELNKEVTTEEESESSFKEAIGSEDSSHSEKAEETSESYHNVEEAFATLELEGESTIGSEEVSKSSVLPTRKGAETSKLEEKSTTEHKEETGEDAETENAGEASGLSIEEGLKSSMKEKVFITEQNEVTKESGQSVEEKYETSEMEVESTVGPEEALVTSSVSSVKEGTETSEQNTEFTTEEKESESLFEGSIGSEAETLEETQSVSAIIGAENITEEYAGKVNTSEKRSSTVEISGTKTTTEVSGGEVHSETISELEKTANGRESSRSTLGTHETTEEVGIKKVEQEVETSIYATSSNKMSSDTSVEEEIIQMTALKNITLSSESEGEKEKTEQSGITSPLTVKFDMKNVSHPTTYMSSKIPESTEEVAEEHLFHFSKTPEGGTICEECSNVTEKSTVSPKGGTTQEVGSKHSTNEEEGTTHNIASLTETETETSVEITISETKPTKSTELKTEELVQTTEESVNKEPIEVSTRTHSTKLHAETGYSTQPISENTQKSSTHISEKTKHTTNAHPADHHKTGITAKTKPEDFLQTLTELSGTHFTSTTKEVSPAESSEVVEILTELGVQDEKFVLKTAIENATEETYPMPSSKTVIHGATTHKPHAGSSSTKMVVVIVNNSGKKIEKINETALQKLLNKSISEVNLEYIDLYNISKEPEGHGNKSEGAEVAEPLILKGDGKVCHRSEFESNHACICDVDPYLKSIEHKLGDNLKVDIKHFNCSHLVSFHDGLIISNATKPVERRKRSLMYLSNKDRSSNVIENDDIEDVFGADYELQTSDSNMLVLPATKALLYCHNKADALLKNEGITYSWEFKADASKNGEILPLNENPLIVHNVEIKNEGNYTCTKTEGGGKKESYGHELEVVTLPIYKIQTTIFYSVNDTCSLSDGDLLYSYLPKIMSPILCGGSGKLCTVDVARPRCFTKNDDNFFNVTVTATMNEVGSIFPGLDESKCSSTNCKLKAYTNMVGLVNKNAEIVKKLPVFSRINPHLEFLTNVSFTGGKVETSKPPKIITTCAGGYGIEKFKQRICVVCPKHTFSGDDEAFCKICPAGQYQPQVGSKACLPCSSPVDDSMCLRMLYTDTKLFKIYVGVAFGLVLLMIFIIIFWNSSTKRYPKRQFEGSLKHHRAMRRRNVADIEKQDLEPLLKKDNENRRNLPPEVPPPDF